MNQEERSRLRDVRSSIRTMLQEDRVAHLDPSKDSDRVVYLRATLREADHVLKYLLADGGRR